MRRRTLRERTGMRRRMMSYSRKEGMSRWGMCVYDTNTLRVQFSILRQLRSRVLESAIMIPLRPRASPPRISGRALASRPRQMQVLSPTYPLYAILTHSFAFKLAVALNQSAPLSAMREMPIALSLALVAVAGCDGRFR